jgi:hypothetical protein
MMLKGGLKAGLLPRKDSNLRRVVNTRSLLDDWRYLAATEPWMQKGRSARGKGALRSVRKTCLADYCSSLCVLPKEIRNGIFPCFAFRYVEHPPLQLSLIQFKFNVVHRQEHYRRNSARSLVSVDERMVLHDVEKICRSHLK